MNQSTPTIPETPKATESDEARVGVVVGWWPEPFTEPAHTILQNALQAGLQRHGVELTSPGSYFRPLFSVHIYTVSAGMKDAAMAALKETITSLNLNAQSIFATATQGRQWEIVGGIFDGALDFEAMFLETSQIEKWRQESMERIQQRFQAGDWLKKRAAEKSNPESE